MKTLLGFLSIFLLAFAVQAKTVNIIDFGAIPDDGTDDTRAVQEAIEKLQNFGGGTLVFPEGTTDIGGQLNSDRRNRPSAVNEFEIQKAVNAKRQTYKGGNLH
jgi:hypothetical protein